MKLQFRYLALTILALTLLLLAADAMPGIDIAGIGRRLMGQDLYSLLGGM